MKFNFVILSNIKNIYIGKLLEGNKNVNSISEKKLWVFILQYFFYF